MNVPLSLASCLAPSVVPSLTAAMANHNKHEAKQKIRTSIRFTMIITIPCAAGMAALAKPILTMLYPNLENGRALAVGIMQVGALMIILYALSTLTTGILQGLGKLRDARWINNSIALVLHFILLYVLLTVFNLNIYAVVYANIFFAFVVCVLNAVAINRFLGYRQEWYKTFIVPSIVSIIMGAAAYIIYSVFHVFAGRHYFHDHGHSGRRLCIWHRDDLLPRHHGRRARPVPERPCTDQAAAQGWIAAVI